MTYPKLSPEEFGRALITTCDLDPVYSALADVEWPEEQKKRWMVAYWLFYHPGFASMASAEQAPVVFWQIIDAAARNDQPSPLGERWPRASERRHFRGANAIEAVRRLTHDWPEPDALVTWIAESGPEYAAIHRRVCSLPQFGPWMAFKVADMLERCLGVRVDFDLASVTMFDDPRKAAIMAARRFLKMPDAAKFKDEPGVIRGVVEHLIQTFADLPAPPDYGRAIGLQEVETVLCKWKSHVNGHYPVGKDIREIRHGLSEWARVSEAAAEFLHYMPPIPARDPASAAA